MDRKFNGGTPADRRLAGAALVAVTLVAASVATTGAAASTGAAAEVWHKDGPGGAQYVDGYDLTKVFADKGVWYYSFVPEPGKESFLALARVDDPTTYEMTTTVVRMTPTSNGRLKAAKVLAFDRLRDPDLWSDEVVLKDAGINAGAPSGAPAISVAPGGDVFIAATASVPGGLVDQTLVRLGPGGSLQKVAAAQELIDADVFGEPVDWPMLGAVAVSDNELYGRAEASIAIENGYDVVERLVQIVDPNGDGDWSDRVIRPIVLPESVPQVEDGVYDWFYGGFVPLPADQMTTGLEASASVLLPIFGESEYRVYRLTDLSGDGILTEPGEAELVFTTEVTPGSLRGPMPPMLTVVPDASGATTLAFVGLTNASRVSIADGGSARDVVRGLLNPSGLIASADGSLLIGDSGEGSIGKQPYAVLSLAAGAPSAAASSATTATATLPSPGQNIIPRAPLTPDVPRISVWAWATSPKGDDVELQLLYGADGSGPRDVLPGVQALWSSPCRSADGSMAAAWAEVDVPNEQPLYLFDTAGSTPPVMVTEQNGTAYCPFPDSALALASEGDIESRTVSRIDLANGFTATPLVEIRQGLCPAVTGDGRYVAVASGDGTTLSLVDVVEGSVRPLAEELNGTVVRSAWTPDGSRLAFVTGPYDPMQIESSVTDTFEVFVLDVAAGTPPQQVFSVEGPAPDVTWSPDGRLLAVLGKEQEAACGCQRQGTLTVLDTITGAARTVTSDATFAEWSPVDPGVFAWGNLTSLTIETAGVARIVEPPTVKADKGKKPASWSGFMGWSPDGRYLGFGVPRLMTVDTTNDQARIMLTETDDLMLISTEWWD